MINFDMKHLTYEEESSILMAMLTDKIDGGMQCDNGSSRSVYLDLGHNTQHALEKLGIDTNCVIKVNIGSAGCLQSLEERETYERACGNGHEGYFAAIYAYGAIIQIVERLDLTLTYDFFEYIFCCGYESDDDAYYELADCGRAVRSAVSRSLDYGWSERELYHFAEQMGDYLNTICLYTGTTGDNYQIGLDDCGNLKCFDYGYNNVDGSDEYHESHCFTTCGDSWYISQHVAEYITELLSAHAVLPRDIQEIAQGF